MTEFGSHIARLYFRAQAGSLTPAEQQEWEGFRRDHPEQAAHLDSLEDSDEIARLFQQRSVSEQDTMTQEILDIVLSRITFGATAPVKTVHRVPSLTGGRHFLKTAWLRYAAAIIILFGIGTYIWINNIRQHPPALTTTTVSPTSDIAPGYSKATLTLSDGKTVELNKNATEKISDGALFIDNNNGELIYRSSTVVAMNTMTTPKGGQYQLTLADGTRVWLNAASSITYPTAFTGKTREVIITGEAYFEVAKNKSAPFIVRTDKEKITVLGTSFNVNRYSDEPAGKISLIEGAIKINEQILQPGAAYVNGKIVKTNIDQDIAWKNGVFNFTNKDLVSIMRQIERWYDVQVVFEGSIPAISVEGKLPREFTLQQTLAAFSDYRLRYRLEGKKLIISP